MVREGGGGGAYGIPSHATPGIHTNSEQNDFCAVRRKNITLFVLGRIVIELIGWSELGLTIGPQVLIFSLCIGPNH